MELPGGEDLAVHYESPETTNEKVTSQSSNEFQNAHSKD